MIALILDRLKQVNRRGQNYMACCPAHDDKHPSLAIRELTDGRILLKCFAGCEISSIMAAINLSVSDLFPKGSLGEYKSFTALERQYESLNDQKLNHDEIILAIAKSDRANGKRLSQEDMERERQAYLRVRHAQNHR